MADIEDQDWSEEDELLARQLEEFEQGTCSDPAVAEELKAMKSFEAGFADIMARAPEPTVSAQAFLASLTDDGTAPPAIPFPGSGVVDDDVMAAGKPEDIDD